MGNTRKISSKVCGTCQYWLGKRKWKNKISVCCFSKNAKCDKYNARFKSQIKNNGSSCINYDKWDGIER